MYLSHRAYVLCMPILLIITIDYFKVYVQCSSISGTTSAEYPHTTCQQDSSISKGVILCNLEFVITFHLIIHLQHCSTSVAKRSSSIPNLQVVKKHCAYS